MSSLFPAQPRSSPPRHRVVLGRKLVVSRVNWGVVGKSKSVRRGFMSFNLSLQTFCIILLHLRDIWLFARFGPEKQPNVGLWPRQRVNIWTYGGFFHKIWFLFPNWMWQVCIMLLIKHHRATILGKHWRVRFTFFSVWKKWPAGAAAIYLWQSQFLVLWNWHFNSGNIPQQEKCNPVPSNFEGGVAELISLCPVVYG